MKLATTGTSATTTSSNAKVDSKKKPAKPYVPLIFEGRAGCLVGLNGKEAGYAGILDGSVNVRWIFSNLSTSSIISNEALLKTDLKTRHPYKATYHEPDPRDRVTIRNIYTAEPIQGVIGKIRVPFELSNEQGLGQLHHDFFIVEHSPVRIFTIL